MVRRSLCHFPVLPKIANKSFIATYNNAILTMTEALGLGICMIGCVAPVLERRKDLIRKDGLPVTSRRHSSGAR